jgi:hypothetical protein
MRTTTSLSSLLEHMKTAVSFLLVLLRNRLKGDRLVFLTKLLIVKVHKMTYVDFLECIKSTKCYGMLKAVSVAT